MLVAGCWLRLFFFVFAGVIDPDKTICVGLARVGTHDQLIVAGTINEMLNVNFGPPLHSMVICSSELHELEKQMLAEFSVKNSGQESGGGGNSSTQAEWAMASTVSSIAVQLEEEEEVEEVGANEGNSGGFAAAMAAVALEEAARDGDEMASECSDMSDTDGDIFGGVPMGGVIGSSDDED